MVLAWSVFLAQLGGTAGTPSRASGSRLRFRASARFVGSTEDSRGFGGRFARAEVGMDELRAGVRNIA